MSSEPRTFRNRVANVARRAARTLKSSVCMGTKRIRDSNIGTEGTQCGKFARFKEIYQDYVRDPNEEVAYLVRNVEGSRRQLEMVVERQFDPSQKSQSEYIDYIQKFIEQATAQRQIFREDIEHIPETTEYAQLKEELRYFVSFMFAYYIQLLNNLIPTGVENDRDLNWDGRSMSSNSNASNLGLNESTLSNNVSRKGSNISVQSGEWFPKSATSHIPNWKGGAPPCPPGQTRNKNTKECRDKKGAKPPCPPGQTRNRHTKECRDKKGAKPPCPPGQTRNRTSKLCRTTMKRGRKRDTRNNTPTPTPVPTPVPKSPTPFNAKPAIRVNNNRLRPLKANPLVNNVSPTTTRSYFSPNNVKPSAKYSF